MRSGTLMPVPDEWHGWAVQGKALHVGSLPGRKQICLYFHEGSRIRTVAFFKTDEQAREVLQWLDTLAASRFVLDTLNQEVAGDE